MRTHGWAGATPASDQEAIERILDTADAVIERGGEPGIADIARTLGITRQTVYRYFPGTDALLTATAQRAADGFIDRIAGQVAGLHDPGDAIVEAMALTIEQLPHDPRVAPLMTAARRGWLAAGVTSPIARRFGRAIIDRFDVDWAAAGFDDTGRDELVELMLRLLQSFVLDPGDPPREPEALRRFLRRWVAPAVTRPSGAPADRGRALM